jgi:prepilin-type N-terminal cleavage/methylation domain-containing protein
MPRPAASQRPAFTLVELLVVIAIIATLLGLMLPAVQRVRESASRTRCANHLKQIGLAIHNYHDAARCLPPSRQDPGGTWMVFLLPFVEQSALASAWQVNQSFYWQTPAARETPVPIYFCPSRRSPGDGILSDDSEGSIGLDLGKLAPGVVADYAVSIGDPAGHADYWWTPSPAYAGGPTNGAFIMFNNWDRTSPSRGQSRRRVFASIKDGLSRTLFVGEKHVPLDLFARGPWDGAAYNGDYGSAMRKAGAGAALAQDPYERTRDNFGSVHPGVCQFVFGDGSVHPLRTTIDPVILGQLANIADGQPVHDGDY